MWRERTFGGTSAAAPQGAALAALIWSSHPDWSADQVRSVLRRLKAEFDMILIDTPPMTHIPDARLLARQADAAILVVAQNTNRDTVGMACQRLAEDGSTLLGAILNNWNPKAGTRGYPEYRAYYRAYHQSA